MEHKFQSGEEYAQALIDDMVRLDSDLMNGPSLDKRLMEIWIENIRQFTKDTYREYILGFRDSYMLTDSEFKVLFSKSSLQYTEEIVHGLVDKGVLQMEVGDDGQIVYGLTNEGKKLI